MTTVSSLPKGSTLARAVMALGLAKGDVEGAAAYAARAWGNHSRVAIELKDAVSAGNTLSPDYPMVGLDGALAEFFGLVEQRSIIGRLTGLRRLPPRTATLMPTEELASQWVGEGQGKVIGGAVFARSAALELRKLVSISVNTKELFESSSPNAETIIRREMLRSFVTALNSAFIDPTNAGEEGIKPRSVTYNIGAVGGGSPTGTFENDFEDLVGDFTGDLEAAYLIMSPLTAVKLSGAARPNIGARGGEIAGLPVITSNDVAADVIVLLDPTGIAIVEGPGRVRTSEEAAIHMVDETTMNSTTPTPATLVSMWQSNSVAILTEREMNWRVVRPNAVSLITNANY